MLSRAFWSVVVVGGCAGGVSWAQPPSDVTPAPLSGTQFLPPYPATGLYPANGLPYGGYARSLGPSGVSAYGFYVPRGFWPNGLSLYGPPVPVPGPIPGVFGNSDLNRNWQAVPFNGVGPFGAVGIYAGGPRLRFPAVPTMPIVERLSPATPVAPLGKRASPILLSIRVPQPAAQVLVNGKPTGQTGTDRTYESPPLEAGETYKYVVTARWFENGQIIEMTKTATGTPGEVVRVDFGR